jgi:hypothetical protein
VKKKDQRTPRDRPNSLPTRQEGNDSAQEQWTASEERALIGAGFERQDEEADLWSKDGVLYGRNAALQKVGIGEKPLASD